MVPDIVSVVEVSAKAAEEVTDSLVAIVDAVLVVALDMFSGGTSSVELEATEDWQTVSEPLI